MNPQLLFETTIVPVKSGESGVSHTISVVGEGNSCITVSLFKQHTSIRFYKVFLNSDAASGATAANSDCECVTTNFSSERVADSLFSFEKYSSATLAVPP